MSTLSSRPTLRKKARSQRIKYTEPDTDPDSDFGSPPPRRSLPIRASKLLRAEHEDDESSNETSSSREAHPSPPRSRVRIVLPVKRMTRAAGPVEDTSFSSFKRRKTIHTASQVSQKDKSFTDVIVPCRSKPERIPPWQSLEYQILLNVMRYAAYPFYTGASRDTGSFRWLLNTSELCRSFHDACIGALMYSPPLFPANRANWLVDLLKASQRDYGGIDGDDMAPLNDTDSSRRLSLDYRWKVKVLDIEVKQLLIKKAGIALDDLLEHVPLLKDLRLYHNHDALADKYIWAHPLHSRSKDRWTYSALFDTLDSVNVELNAFEWNGRFLKDDPDLASFVKVQLGSKSLRNLRSISLRNLLLPNVEKTNEHVVETNIKSVQKLTNMNTNTCRLLSWRSTVLKVLDQLPELKHLALHTCNIFDDKTIEALPTGLTQLSIIDCPFIKSEGLANYLQVSGSSLRSLILRGNQSLSLGWMSTLKTTTSHLRQLDIDLTYHDITSFRDTDPLFDDLLPDGSPTWPDTLQSISIDPLRNLSAQDAEDFYQSLVHAAPELPFLRSLCLRTLLSKVGWRDRAAMRQKWDATLNHVFNINFNPKVKAPSEPSTDVDSQNSTSRKSRRLLNNDLAEIGQKHSLNSTSIDVVRQGRCHTVVFELSDQRPAQDQFREADFLDDEPDDDAEWDGRDTIEPPKYSARRYGW